MGIMFLLVGYCYVSENYNLLSEVISLDDDFYDNYGKCYNCFEVLVNQ